MGVHALALLAIEPDQSHTSEQLAAAIGTNPVVVRRILASLRKAGIVTSQKGPSGGTRLAEAPKRITLAGIYQAIERRPVLAFPYGTNGVKDAGHRRTGSTVKEIFDEANRAVAGEMENITLAQISKRNHRGRK